VAKIVIRGVPEYDGEYEFDADHLTNGELHTIKKISGVRPNEFDDAINAADNDLFVAFVVIALERAGHQVDMRVIWAARTECFDIDLTGEEGEDDADPPPPPTALSPPGSKPPSGSSSPATTAPPESGQSPTGTQG
jgi:hypothetical protein